MQVSIGGNILNERRLTKTVSKTAGLRQNRITKCQMLNVVSQAQKNKRRKEITKSQTEWWRTDSNVSQILSRGNRKLNMFIVTQ